MTSTVDSLAPGLAIGACTVAFIAAAVELRAQFPGSYTWTELLISYQGGFMRRGLAGELGFLVDPWIGVDLTITGVLLVGYLLVNTTVIVLLSRRASLVGWLCVVSPGLLLFPLWDSAAFGRKDVVILVAFVASLLMILRVKSAWRCFAVLAALYSVTGLVHETGWIYFVAAIGAMLLLRADDGAVRLRVALASVVCLALWTVLVIAFKGSEDQTLAMMHAWSDRYPNAYSSAGAATFLGHPISSSVFMVGYHQRHIVTTAGYVGGFLLTGAPVALLALQRWRSVVTNRRGWIALVALVALLVPFVIAADWGRYTHLFWMHVLLFLAVLPSFSRARWGLQPKLLAAVALVVYALSWHVLHFAPGGTNPLRPGPLLWWM